MKRFLHLLTATTLAFFVLSCNQEEIDNLQTQIDEIKSDQIAPISSQVAGILVSIDDLRAVDSAQHGYIETLQEQRKALEKADQNLTKSIADLKTELSGDISAAEANALAQLEAYKSTVTKRLESINTSLDVLQTEDKKLQQQITTLQNYVDNGLKTYIDSGDNSVKTWSSATFVTLQQFDATSGIISTIQGQITTINQQIEQLGGGSDGISQTELNAAISALDESLRSEIGKAIADCNSAISTAKNEITSAYTNSIQEAISTSESSMKTWVNKQLAGYYTVAQTDAKIAALKTNIEGQLTSQKTYLEGLISSLETSLTQKINNNKTLISGLQTQLNGLNSDLSELAGKVASNTTNISKNAAAITSNAKAIATNATDIDKCEQLIAANKQLISDNEEAIAANASAITALQNRATADEKLISDNASAIAKNAQDISANAALISTNATAISNNAKAISDNAADILQLRSDLSTTRTEITAAYQQAISAAISTLDGKLSGQIADEVATINSRIDTEVSSINTALDALTGRVTQCEKDIKSIKNTIYSMQQDIEDLQGQVAAILARIQSIAFVPAYSDGKVPVSYTDNGSLTPGTAVLDFELQPASTAADLAQVWQTALKMKAVYTVTRSAPETVQLAITSVVADKGFLKVSVSGSALAEDFFRSRCRANAALVISDGNNELASEYVPLVPWTTDVISFGCPNFKSYCLENFDKDGDGEITEDEADAVTAISASMLNITSLVGIEYFSNLESIDVSFNKLETLDLSHSPKLETILVNGNKLQSLGLAGLVNLKSLDCSNNKLTALDVSESEALTTLICSGNSLGALNVRKNKALIELQCSNNQIASLDLKNNVKLETLLCRKNALTVLDITKLPLLKNLDCSNNTLASFNTYGNTALETLYCSSCGLSTLGVTANTALTVLDCSGNQLTALDVTKNTGLETLGCANNLLASVDVSCNAALESVDCRGNANMARLWVKDAAQQAALSVRKEDATQIAFNNGGINIPDVNLKNYLLALFDDDEDGEVSIAEAENVQNVNCSGRGITSLVGLECCPNLKYLNFSGNAVAVAELPNLTKLETIVAYGNPIERLVMNNDKMLTGLYLQAVDKNAYSIYTNGKPRITIERYDQAATLYIAFAGVDIETLVVKDSPSLTALDATENVQLGVLNASGNPLLTSLDISKFPSLHYLKVNGSGLTSLDVSQNENMTELYCSSNALTDLNVDNCPRLKIFDCSGNNLSSLRISNNPMLETVNVADNQLLNINVRKNMLLKSLNVSCNSGITALALGNNLILEKLNASQTSIADIDIAENVSLSALDLSECQNLTILDVTNNSLLTNLNVYGCQLSSLKISGEMECLIGQYVIASGQKGVIFSAQNSVVKIMSMDETYAQWMTYNETSILTESNNGRSNTDKMLEYDSPAAQWCRDKGSAWYLPVRYELIRISDNLDVLNATLSNENGKLLRNGNYWSSELESSQYSRYITVGVSFTGYNSMTTKYWVRAVRGLY